MRILLENSCGLVIDIQERLLPHIARHEELLKRVEILLEGLNILHIPLLVTEQYTKGLGPTVQGVKEKLLNFQAVEKMSFSCCDEPLYMSELKALGKKQVIICGIETHVCVLQTTIDLIAAGYAPVVVADCVSSRRESDKSVALERMKGEGAIITTSESILFELARVSGTDHFKAISKLVK